MLLRLFAESQADLARLTFRVFFPARGQAWPSWRRRLTMAAFVPVFALAQWVHWLGFLLDELLFPGYRRVEIREPVFVLGVPRSGTTHLHRVLAADEQFTTFSTWECLLALSVTARRFWLSLARIDARIGRPLGRAIGWLEPRLFGGLSEIHSMRLGDPEEDYFALMPVLACFILVLPFPHSDRLWRMAAFDRDMPAPQRQRLLGFYRLCLQRHLYVHGPERRLLSKNAAFAPLAASLAEQFPDARFIVCLREPEETLPSQLSSVASGIHFFDALSQTPDLQARLVERLGFYYRSLEQALGSKPEDRCVWVTMKQLGAGLGDRVRSIYQRLGLTLAPGFADRLAARDLAARRYRSAHGYRAEDFGLSHERIIQDLGAVYARLAARARS